MLKVRGHGVVLHGHEERIEDNTDGDGQVHERIHDNEIDYLLDFNPLRAALPDQERVGKFIPARRTLALRLLQF